MELVDFESIYIRLFHYIFPGLLRKYNTTHLNVYISNKNYFALRQLFFHLLQNEKKKNMNVV